MITDRKTKGLPAKDSPFHNKEMRFIFSKVSKGIRMLRNMPNGWKISKAPIGKDRGVLHMCKNYTHKGQIKKGF